MGKYIEYPFDTVKVRLQSQPDHLPLRYTGPLDCFRQSIRGRRDTRSIPGISAPLVGAALETSSLFFFERMGREAVYGAGLCSRDSSLPLSALWFTGAFSGVFTSFILTPIELVKCKIQVPETVAGVVKAPLKPLQVVRGRIPPPGPPGLLARPDGDPDPGKPAAVRRGSGARRRRRACCARSTCARPPPRRRGTGSTTARSPCGSRLSQAPRPACPYNFLFFPPTRSSRGCRTSPIGESAGTRTFLGESKALWRKAGLRGFYRGCGITVVRSAPSSAFIFMVYDGLKTYLPLS